MKKFLTVLLVIAVMFTFSFGSAFAADVDDQIIAKVAEEQADMAEAVYKYAAKFIYNQAGYLVAMPDGTEADKDLTKAAVEAGIEAIIATYNDKIEAAGLAQQAAGTYDAAAIENAWVGADSDVAFAEEATAVYTKAVADAKEALEEAIASVDLEGYASADKADLKLAIKNAEEVAEAAGKDAKGLDDVIGAKAALLDAVDKVTPVAKQEDDLAKYKEKAMETIVALADQYVAGRAEKLEAIINADAPNYAEMIKAQAELATLAENADAVVALYEERIAAITIETTYTAATEDVDAQVDYATQRLTDVNEFNELVNLLANTDQLVVYAESLANSMKNEYNRETGLAVYNAATVEAKLAEVVAEIEDLTYRTYDAVYAAMDVPTAEEEAETLETAIENGVKDITEGEYAADKWDGENKTAVKAIQDDYKAQIKAADTAKEIEALVKAAKEAMDAYLRIDDAKALLDRLDYTLDGYEAKLASYAAGLAATDVNGEYYPETLTEIVADAREVLEDAIVATQDKDLTVKEAEAICDANYAEALAVVGTMMTKDELKAEKDAVEAAIDALPTVPTLETKAEYLAAKEMLDAYNDLAGSPAISAAKQTKLTNYLNKLERLDKEAVVALVKALPIAKNVTIADKAAVLEALAAAEAFEDEYDKAFDASIYAKKLDDVKTALENALMLDAAKKIAALPAEITAADKAAVEAAAAAYANLTEDAKKLFDDKSKPLVDKLAAAEEVLKAELAYTVEALKITAKSEAKKGSITVKWSVKGETAAVEGYEIWKSTKKNSGFKKMFTTTKLTYKNTKGLKKGTRYYYKVRAIAYDAEGTKIKSDWSNKAYRIAK